MADQEQRHASKQAREVLADLEDKLFATVPEVAVILRSDVRSIRRAIAAGEIPAQSVGRRKLVPVPWVSQAARLETSEASR